MSAGDLFWFLVWLLTWMLVIATPVFGVYSARKAINLWRSDARWDDPTGWAITGGLALVGSVFLMLVVVAFATGEWSFSHSLLQDGCYRVGHETYWAGKNAGVRNTFELIESCR